jgi:HSP20 family protein
MALFRFSPGTDPVSDLLSLQRELERVFESPLGFDLGPSGRGVFPPVNVFTGPDGYVVRLEVPGVAPDQVTVESHGRTLSVRGKRQFNAPTQGSFHRRERGEGEFSRSIQLPADVECGRAEASCRNGLLTIRIPKREEAKPRQITVQPV